MYFFPRRVKSSFLSKLRVFVLDFNSKLSFLKLFALYILIFFEKIGANINSLWSRASWKSVLVSLVGNRFSINNLGNVYSINGGKLSITQRIEKQVVEWNKKIINCHDEKTEGYITSGGTESNLFLMWMGREYLKLKGDSEPLLLTTNFTHYSVSKSGRILDIDFHFVRVDKRSWGMDLVNLEKVFLRFIEKKRYLFLLPITIGYSSTGASDPLVKIVSLVKELKQQHPKFECFMWVDAAAQGLPKSFLENNFKPLQSSLIQGYVVDFHKYGDSPLPSGIVLYRGSLRKLIETPISYLAEDDSTILGSRSGASVLAIWANIIGGNNKWRRKFIRLEKRKNDLVKNLKEKNPNANILYFKNSLTFAVEVNSDLNEFSREFGDEHSFLKCDINGFIHYKFHNQ